MPYYVLYCILHIWNRFMIIIIIIIIHFDKKLGLNIDLPPSFEWCQNFHVLFLIVSCFPYNNGCDKIMPPPPLQKKGLNLTSCELNLFGPEMKVPWKSVSMFCFQNEFNAQDVGYNPVSHFTNTSRFCVKNWQKR